MKFLTLLLSTTLLTSTAAIASAAPKAAPRKPTIETRVGPKVIQRDHRVRPVAAWQKLAALKATGTRSTVTVPRAAGALDTLRLDVSRGALTVRKVVVTFTDGSKHVATVGARLTPGDSKVIRIPGTARRIAKVEVRYGKNARAQLALSAR